MSPPVSFLSSFLACFVLFWELGTGDCNSAPWWQVLGLCALLAFRQAIAWVVQCSAMVMPTWSSRRVSRTASLFTLGDGFPGDPSLVCCWPPLCSPGAVSEGCFRLNKIILSDSLIWSDLVSWESEPALSSPLNFQFGCWSSTVVYSPNAAGF